MEDDDAAQAEVDQWIRDNDAAAAKGGGVPSADLKRRIRDRFEPIRRAYDDFIKRHPDHARARVAYGSFLSDLQDEDGAQEQWEKALALNPKDPAVYNNLANLLRPYRPGQEGLRVLRQSHRAEPAGAHLLSQLRRPPCICSARTPWSFTASPSSRFMTKRSSSTARPSSSTPTNFPLASDVAQTYYGIKPLRLEDALKAWTNTLALAHDEIEREGRLSSLRPAQAPGRPLRRSPRAPQRRHQRHVRGIEETPGPQPG